MFFLGSDLSNTGKRWKRKRSNNCYWAGGRYDSLDNRNSRYNFFPPDFVSNVFKSNADWTWRCCDTGHSSNSCCVGNEKIKNSKYYRIDSYYSTCVASLTIINITMRATQVFSMYFLCIPLFVNFEMTFIMHEDL